MAFEDFTGRGEGADVVEGVADNLCRGEDEVDELEESDAVDSGSVAVTSCSDTWLLTSPGSGKPHCACAF
jgi:hypothetical protein